MEKITSRFRVWALLALPLFAVVAVVLALSWGHSGGTQVEANTTGPDLSISAGGGACDTDGGAAKCTFTAGSSFVVVASLNSFKPLPTWAGHQVQLDYTGGLTQTGKTDTWPACGIPAEFGGGAGPATYKAGCSLGIGGSPDTYTGSIVEIDFQCGSTDTSDTITLVHGAPLNSHIIDAGNNASVDPDANEVLQINCEVPTATPTATNAPSQQKTTSLGLSASKVFSDESVVATANADYAQDMDNDGVAGWGAGQIALSVSPSGPVIKNAAASAANAACAPVDASSAGCIAVVDKTTQTLLEATGPITVTADVNCADAVGDFTVTATSSFLREDGSAVPPEKSISNVATADFTCSPLIPAIQKLDVGTTGDDPAGDALSNEFLEAQGAKLAPVNCAAGNDVDTLEEVFSLPIEGANTKGNERELAAFEFEVRFDEKLVCVNIVPGTAAANMVCIVRDKDEGLPLEGIAQIGCVTKKGDPFPDTATDAGRQLATIEVRPQPELYSQLIANQDNGIPAQILNQECNLADQDGLPIPSFSCEDADITFRYLEGDVNADCFVDAVDQQLLSFRWGVEIGSLLYNSRYDLEPSGQVKGDGDLDIKDLQFVFGRHGSDCDAPNPAQPPVNPKAVGE